VPDTKVCPQCGRTYPTADRFCTVDGAALMSSGNADSLIGAVLAERYLVQEKLGEGGMGEVYLAEHVRMKRKVAVKLMRSWMLGDPVAVSRFHREAENASQITHPNVAQVYDFGETADGMIYLAMEFVPGEPLSSILDREGRLHAVRAAEIVRQTAEALAAAHHMGILHRDLKPDNVMVAKTRSGTDIVKLVDFGIARAMSRGTQQFTSTGMIVGTPDYMSPEQLAGDSLDERSDLYALALIAFRAITGHPAFPEGATGEALMARLTNNSRRLSAVFPSIHWPETLQAAFDRALASDPEQRYADALEFANELDAAALEIPLTDEAQAYLTALSQRMSTPARLGVIPDGTTPTVPVRASTAVRTPSGEMPRVSTGGAASPPRRPTPSVPVSSVSAPTPTSATHLAGRTSAADEPPRSDAATASLGVVSRADTPVQAEGAALAPRSRRPVLLAIGAIAAVTLAFAATKLRPARESGQTVALPPTVSKADSSVASVALPPVDSAAAAAPIPAAADSARIARAVRQGVFAVASSAGRGTAFLVEAGDGRGIALTSASALPRDRSEPIELFLEPDRRVRGTLLAVDSTSGVAALLVSLKSCSRCKALDVLAADSAIQPVEGDSVVANSIGGRAGHRPVRMALGKIGPKSLASTIRVTSANAGAPVLSTKSGSVAVVAIAAMNPGRGASSAAFVPSSVLRETVARAKSEQAAKSLQPNDSVFWSWPVRTVDAGVIEKARKRSAEELPKYKIAADGFALLAMTPQVMAWRAATYGAAMAEANPFAIGATDPIDKWPAWNAYRGERRAVVVFHVTPEKAALPDFPNGVVDFKRGDFVSMQLLRDGQALLPIESARIPAVGNVKEYNDRKRDVYNAGILVFHPFDFAPNANGGWASYEAVIVDARRRDKPTRIALTTTMLQAIAADLGDWQKR
jgi:eukaryotic-like serine/threonine-protein kinase